MPTLFALCGLPFAGKSTVARRLAAEVGAPIIRLDAINSERGLGLHGAAIPAQEWERTYEEAYRRLDQLLASGHSVIFDHVNFTRAERDVVRHIAGRHAANVQIIYVAVTPREARKRLIANRKTRARHDVRNEDFDLVVSRFEPPDGEPDVVRWDLRVGTPRFRGGSGTV